MEHEPVHYAGQNVPICPEAPRRDLWTYGDLAKFVLFSLVTVIIWEIALVLVITELFEAADRYLGLDLGIDTGVEYATVAVMALSAVPSLCYVYYLVAIKYRLPFREALGFGPFRQSMCWFLFVGVLIASAEGLVGAELGMPQGNPFGHFVSDPGSYWLLAAVAVLIAPPVEEILFRGFLYRPLERSWGAIGAIGVTTVAFALVHLPQSWQIGFLLTLTGICLGVARWKARSLWAPILMHAGANVVLVVPFGLENFV